MDSSGMESELERAEQDTEQLVDERDRTGEREQQLQEALSKLQEDVETSSHLEENRQDVERQQQDIESRTQELCERAGQIQETLQQLQEQRADSASVLEQLQELGEDISEGAAILEERQRLIDESTDRLNELLQKLGMDAMERSSAGSAGGGAGKGDAAVEGGQEDAGENRSGGVPQRNLEGSGSSQQKLTDRAKDFFQSMFPSAGKDADEAQGEGGVSIRNQILAQDPLPVIHGQLEKLKTKKVHELSKEELSQITHAAVTNLRELYKDRLPASAFEQIEGMVVFVGGEQARQEFAPDVCGYYSPATDSIRINLEGNATVGDLLATIDHEALHRLSDRERVGGGLRDRDIVYENVGMNEGVTELLSIEDMREINPDYVSCAYVDEVGVMREFADIFGMDRLKKAYLEEDPSEMETEFNHYMGNSHAFEKFCNDLDILHHYNHGQCGESAEVVSGWRSEQLGRIEGKLEKYREAKRQDPTGPSPEAYRKAAQERAKKRAAAHGRTGAGGTQARWFSGRRHAQTGEGDTSGEATQAPRSSEQEREAFLERLRVDSSPQQQAEAARRRRAGQGSGSSSSEEDAPDIGQRERTQTRRESDRDER